VRRRLLILSSIYNDPAVIGEYIVERLQDFAALPEGFALLERSLVAGDAAVKGDHEEQSHRMHSEHAVLAAIRT